MPTLSACWVVAAGVGAEAGYVGTQESRSAGETVDDQLILASVKTKFLADSDVSGFNINVDCFKGIVTLRGYVTISEEIEKATRVALGVSGVKQVVSKLVLDAG
jgi:osmotically-inducible protein OsmY